MIVTAHQGDTLDMLIWRHLGTTSGGVIEATLKANPGLADCGPILPQGLQVEITTTTSQSVSDQTATQLW